jgi:hypothetical protein
MVVFSCCNCGAWLWAVEVQYARDGPCGNAVDERRAGLVFGGCMDGEHRGLGTLAPSLHDRHGSSPLVGSLSGSSQPSGFLLPAIRSVDVSLALESPRPVNARRQKNDRRDADCCWICMHARALKRRRHSLLRAPVLLMRPPIGRSTGFSGALSCDFIRLFVLGKLIHEVTTNTRPRGLTRPVTPRSRDANADKRPKQVFRRAEDVP